MKKTFKLTAPNKQPARQVEYVKHEIKKYIARERRKALPSGFNMWVFECKMGIDEGSATTLFANEINKQIDQVVADNKESFYLEVIAKPGKRSASKD